MKFGVEFMKSGIEEEELHAFAGDRNNDPSSTLLLLKKEDLQLRWVGGNPGYTH